MDKLMRNQIGFSVPQSQPENEMTQLKQKVDLLERRVESLENNDGNYQVYLKLKEKFEFEGR
jgi:chaperonin cofactor prefoldin